MIATKDIPIVRGQTLRLTPNTGGVDYSGRLAAIAGGAFKIGSVA